MLTAAFPCKKLGYLGFIGLLLTLVTSAHAASESITAECKVGNGRSSVAVRSTGLRGKFYVLVFSGEGNSLVSEPKLANKKRVLDFRFDSDPAYLTEHPEPLAYSIEPDFIKKREIAVVLRDHKTNGHIVSVRTKCKKYRPNTIPAPINTNVPAGQPASLAP